MSVGGTGRGGRADFEYDHPEVTGGGGAVSEGAESEAAAVGAARLRAPGGPVTDPADFRSWNTNKVSTFRDGGTVTVEGYFNRSIYGTAKLDGRINSPTRGQLFVEQHHFMSGPASFRPMTPAEKRSMVAGLEREIAAGGPQADDLQRVIAKLKAGKAEGTAPAPAATPGVKDLGHLGEPGKTLKDKTNTIKPGESLRFTTSENQIRGLGEITVTPRGALKITRKVLEKPPPGMLGGMSKIEYTITVPKTATPGKVAKLTTAGHFQVRNSPDWAFSTSVKVGRK